MSEFLRKLFTSDLMPHGYCYMWKPDLVWLHAVSDGLIALAYYVIPVMLLYFVRKRKDLPFSWMFVMFGVFIFGCGTTHAMEVWTLWHGTYRLSGVIKAVTAVASLATAVLMLPLVRRALALPSPAQLTAANLNLENEIEGRRRIAEALQETQSELESGVRQRTAELATVNEQLQAEINERRRAEEVLAKQASLLDLAHDAIIVRDMNDTLTYWNTGAEETYGWRKDEALGKAPQQLLLSVYPSNIDTLKERVIREGRWSGEILQTRRDGRQIVVASRWALQRDEEDRPVAILQINTDITAAKEAADALQSVQAQLAHMTRLTTMGELTSSIAHEVNQPLTAVVSNANACLRWLDRAEPNLEEARDATTRIAKEGRRASEVLDRIRSFLKKRPPQPAPVDVNEVICDVLAMTQQESLRNGISQRTELEANVHPVMSDRIQLQQVILNLVMNAIEAMKDTNGQAREMLVASRTLEPDQVTVAVRDSGVGIDPKNLDQLFNPFFSTKKHGMGMGLSISRSLIEAYGGRLWAPPNSGRGSTFQFSLPVYSVT